MSWSVFNKPTSISMGTRTVDIAYGPNRSRYQRIDNRYQTNERTTHYVGSVEHAYTPLGDHTIKRYIGGELIQTITDVGGSVSSSLVVLLKDQLGSTHLIVSEAGALLQGMSFDAYGRRRADGDFAAFTLSQITTFNTHYTTRGYTSHEGIGPGRVDSHEWAGV